MNNVLIAILGVAFVSADWTKYKDATYPIQYEYTSLRSQQNHTSSSVTASSQSHQVDYQSSCSGSTSSLPPWTSLFASLFTTNSQWNGYTGGETINAHHVRYWRLRLSSDGGEEGWISTDPVQGPFDRVRIDRGTPVVQSWQESLEEPPGGGGGG